MAEITDQEADAVDLSVSFLDAGGDSLKAIVASALLTETHGCGPPLESFFEAASLADLLTAWREALAASRDAA